MIPRDPGRSDAPRSDALPSVVTQRHHAPGGVFDEVRDLDGQVRPGWDVLVDAETSAELADLAGVRGTIDRLLADDGVTFRPTSVASLVDVEDVEPIPINESQPWRLDPVPMALDAREWSALETGLTQRAELLQLVLADLYGPQRLLAEGLLPPEVVFSHQEFLRPLIGLEHAHRLFMLACDLGRAPDGQWQVLADRTEAPAGAGYAMQNRRVLSRALPSLYHRSALQRLTPFFHQMRIALVDAAPTTVEDPRVVVLSPGTHAETAFDQAFLAGQLGFPLVEGSDLEVAEDRVWLRTVDRLEPVDVIFRHVPARWADPLELRSGSRLGVTGLTQVARQGNVTVVNSLGSGVLENPALMPYLPRISQLLLNEPLRLPGVESWWGGEPEGRRRLLGDLDQLVIRPVSPRTGRGVLGSMLSSGEREELQRRIEAEPHAFVAQQMLDLSAVPVASADASLGSAPVTLRQFAIRNAESYTVLPGGLAQTVDRHPGRSLADNHLNGSLTKDVWVIDADGAGPERTLGEERIFVGPAGRSIAMVPRVLDDLYWLGRYAERGEDLLRLVLATRSVAVEADPGRGAEALEHLLAAITHVSATYPGFLGGASPDPMAELRDLVLNRVRRGSVARSIAQLTHCAEGVRDQLSGDVWIVLAGVDRALATLRLARFDSGAQLADTSERVLSGLLALSGITAENMVRDPGWYLLECGRGIERASQVLTLLRHTITGTRPGAERPLSARAEGQVIDAALTAAESVVTFRRRHGGRAQVRSVVELLLTDPTNPRSVLFQLGRVSRALAELPGANPASRPQRVIDDLVGRLAEMDAVAISGSDADGRRRQLWELLGELQGLLKTLNEAIDQQYLRRPLVPQPLGVGDHE